MTNLTNKIDSKNWMSFEDLWKLCYPYFGCPKKSRLYGDLYRKIWLILRYKKND